MSNFSRQNHVNPYEGKDKKTNVIWFIVDQMRAQALSYMGDPNVNTPNLDRMAIDGHNFSRACMGFPLCCPARASMVTSQYPHKSVPGHEFKLDPKLGTVADAFNDAGYHTAWLGKWHLDGWHERNGRGGWCEVAKDHRGRFDTWIGYENNNSQWDCWVHGHDGDQEVPHYQLPGHETDALTDMLLDQIEKHKDEPFFHVCSVQPPHDPYSAPPEHKARHNPATLELRPNVPAIPAVESTARRNLAGYYALIEHIDDNVGRVMSKLKELGIMDHTYIMFFSDHGDLMGSHGHFHKMTPREESIRVPFLIWGGQRLRYRGGAEYHFVTNHVDMAPTALGLAGIPVPEAMKGFDYSGFVKGQGDWSDVPDEAYLQSVVPTGHGNSIDLPWRGIVTRDGWKYVAVKGQPLFMFNLNDDPYEQMNLAHYAQFRHQRKALNDKLQTWIDKTDDTFTLPEYDDQGVPVEMTEAYSHFSQGAGLWVE